jgi:WD40 repeat protein
MGSIPFFAQLANAEPLTWEIGRGHVFFALSPDGNTLVSKSKGSQELCGWNTRTGALLWSRQTRPFFGVGNVIVISPDNRFFADNVQCNGWDRHDHVLRNLTTGEGIHEFPTSSHGIRCFTFSPQGHRFAYYDGSASAVIIRGVDEGDVVARLPAGNQLIWDLSYSPDGQTIAALGDTTNPALFGQDNMQRLFFALWDTETGELKADIESLGSASVAPNRLAFSPDSKFVAYAAYNKHVGHRTFGVVRSEPLVLIRSTANGEIKKQLEMPANEGLVFADRGNALVGLSSHRIHICCLETNEITESLKFEKEQSALIGSMGLSADGGLLAVGLPHHHVEVWDTKTGRKLGVLEGPDEKFVEYLGVSQPAPRWPLFFSPDNRRLFAGAVYGRRRPLRITDNVTKVTVWNLEKRGIVAKQTAPETPQSGVAGPASAQ